MVKMKIGNNALFSSEAAMATSLDYSYVRIMPAEQILVRTNQFTKTRALTNVASRISKHLQHNNIRIHGYTAENITRSNFISITEFINPESNSKLGHYI